MFKLIRTCSRQHHHNNTTIHTSLSFHRSRRNETKQINSSDVRIRIRRTIPASRACEITQSSMQSATASKPASQSNQPSSHASGDHRILSLINTRSHPPVLARPHCACIQWVERARQANAGRRPAQAGQEAAGHQEARRGRGGSIQASNARTSTKPWQYLWPGVHGSKS